MVGQDIRGLVAPGKGKERGEALADGSAALVSG